MSQNPEEGRLSEDDKAELLREARKKTTDMKREYRAMRQEKESKDRAERYVKRHQKPHEEVKDEMAKVSGMGGALNRRGRRQYGKKLNVFKLPNGWTNFNIGYKKRWGVREPRRNDTAVPVKIRSNITQALEAAAAEKDKV